MFSSVRVIVVVTLPFYVYIQHTTILSRWDEQYCSIPNRIGASLVAARGRLQVEVRDGNQAPYEPGDRRPRPALQAQLVNFNIIWGLPRF